MGMVVRFPVERARTSAIEVFEDDCAQILILPTVRIERVGETEDDPMSRAHSGTGNSASSRRRRRAPRD